MVEKLCQDLATGWIIAKGFVFVFVFAFAKILRKFMKNVCPHSRWLYLHEWIRIRNTALDPESSWIRIRIHNTENESSSSHGICFYSVPYRRIHKPVFCSGIAGWVDAAADAESCSRSQEMVAGQLPCGCHFYLPVVASPLIVRCLECARINVSYFCPRFSLDHLGLGQIIKCIQYTV